MEFKCIFHDEPVGECPPVQELERLRKENRELKERIREMEATWFKPEGIIDLGWTGEPGEPGEILIQEEEKCQC